LLGVILRIALIALIALIAFGVVVFVVWAAQERLVFFPPRVPPEQGFGAARVDFSSTDGQPLFGFFIPGTGKDSAGGGTDAGVSHRLILHFHGNGDLAHTWVGWAQEAARRTGDSVFLAEYRGYGGLPGRPTYERVMRDARATMAFVQERYGVTADEIVLYGHSLGTGVATQLAAEQGAREVLLEAPITSIVDAGCRSFIAPLSFVIPWICRIHFAPVDQVRRIEAPVSIVCGEKDEVAPPSMSQSVFAAALHPGEFLLVERAGHDDIAESAGEKYWQWFSRALRANCATIQDESKH